MALKATIFKVTLQVADLDRNYYGDHVLTLARHPSETDIRMMLRILVFALHASNDLAFTRGISTDDEPDLWCKADDGKIALWIDLGQPDEKRLRKACGRARRVVVYSYSGTGARIWWDQVKDRVERFANLAVINLAETAGPSLEAMVQRSMILQCTLQDGLVLLTDGTGSVQIEPETWKMPVG